MKSVETYGELDYQEGVDYEIEEVYEDSLKQFRFFFRDSQERLLGFMSVNIHLEKTAMTHDSIRIAYIIDTCSSPNFEKYFSKTFQEFFLKNGYTPGIGLKGFGRTMFIYTLAFIKEKYPDCEIVLVNALPKNEAQVWKLIEKVQSSTQNLIAEVRGGNDINMATLFLHTDTKDI